MRVRRGLLGAAGITERTARLRAAGARSCLLAEDICLAPLDGRDASHAESALLGAGQIGGAERRLAADAAAGAGRADGFPTAWAPVLVRPGAYRRGIGDSSARDTPPSPLGGDQHPFDFTVSLGLDVCRGGHRFALLCALFAKNPLCPEYAARRPGKKGPFRPSTVQNSIRPAATFLPGDGLVPWKERGHYGARSVRPQSLRPCQPTLVGG